LATIYKSLAAVCFGKLSVLSRTLGDIRHCGCSGYWVMIRLVLAWKPLC